MPPIPFVSRGERHFVCLVTVELGYERDFEILIDGRVIANQKLEGNHSDGLFDVYYEIPTELTKGKQKIEVKFLSQEGKIAGGVYGVRIVRSIP
ncbi:DUF6805 domain-containing protein [Geobacillus thermodenitrificans]|uniref:DUF6805 domain-containing protein n=1 Tax=Geobacillus thermodenitrificans TaxID=33940 RepID=UPI0035B5687D